MADFLSRAWAPQDGQALDEGLEAIGRVAGGDTGLRQIKGLLDPTWTANNIFIRRVGFQVYMELQSLASVSGPEGEWGYLFPGSSGAIPTGFQPIGGAELSFIARPDNVATMRRASVTNTGSFAIERAADWGSIPIQLTWWVTTPFPTGLSLPGEPF